MSSPDSNDSGDGCLTLLLCIVMFFIGSRTGANSVYEEAQKRGFGEMKNGEFIWKEEKDESNR